MKRSRRETGARAGSSLARHQRGFRQDYYFARRYDEAIAQLRKTLEMDPDFYFAHRGLGDV